MVFCTFYVVQHLVLILVLVLVLVLALAQVATFRPNWDFPSPARIP